MHHTDVIMGNGHSFTSLVPIQLSTIPSSIWKWPHTKWHTLHTNTHNTMHLFYHSDIISKKLNADKRFSTDVGFFPTHIRNKKWKNERRDKERMKKPCNKYLHMWFPYLHIQNAFRISFPRHTLFAWDDCFTGHIISYFQASKINEI